MKRLLLLLALLGCESRLLMKVTEVKETAIISPDNVPSEEMVIPPDPVTEDCPAVLWSACEAAMPGVVRIKRAYVVHRGFDGSLVWAACSNVVCVKASE